MLGGLDTYFQGMGCHLLRKGLNGAPRVMAVNTLQFDDIIINFAQAVLHYDEYQSEDEYSLTKSRNQTIE